ncbi:DUF6174 domain-containing protein [Rubrivirga sp. IMCC43871]|uniref:DUF6174 domain-containing protein n=1 Tax=Rubrivirga sp. IMCC43871 TaxID=3391575 RepID=UPI0039901187
MLRLALFAAVLIPLAGCPAPAEIDPIEPPMLPGGPAAVRSPDLDAAMAKWADAELDAYTMTLRRMCFCPTPDYTGPFSVTVRDGEVATVRLDGATVPAERGMSVEDLFELLEDAYAREAEVVEVSFDPDLGYPSAINIDYSSRMADEEIAYGVSDLKPAGR